MMSNRRGVTSRVQGSWAPPRRATTNSKLSTDSCASSWAGKQNIGVGRNTHTFQTVSPSVLEESPKLRVLRESGEHSLGTTVNGSSEIQLDLDFLDKHDADWMFETLLNEISWKQQKNTKYGTNESRLTEWYSDYAYSYSGVVQQPNQHWHPLVTALCDRLNEKYSQKFNSVLANYYRDGHDSVDWHTDGELALGRCPPIASISLGDTRNFELRPMLAASSSDSEQESSNQAHYRIPLTHGCLLLMLGATQHDWQHRVPREYHDRKARINLTFRVMHPENVLR